MAQSMQTAAHSLQICFTNSLSLAMDSIANKHIAAHSLLSLMHRASIFISDSLRSAEAQRKAAIAVAEQAVILEWNFNSLIFKIMTI